MRYVFGLVLIAGVGLAGGAVYMAKNRIGAYQYELQRAQEMQALIVPTVDVYVAERPLKYGEVLKKEDVRLIKWPESALPEGVFKADDALFTDDDAKPRMVVRAMETNEAIMAIKVTEPGEDAGITSRLERGMRAFAIEVDVSSGVSGFLRPGDRVDVYWTGRVTSGTQGESGDFTKLIEAGVRLIAVDQTADGNTNQANIARTVTVAISPQQVASLAQAQSTGRLSLSLVGATDDTVASAIEVNQSSLLGLVSAPAPQAVKEQEICTIRTRKGAEVVKIEIPCTN